MRFIANLKPYTFHRGPGVPRFSGYLLSVDYAREHARLARRVVDERRVLCADNGNVHRIRALTQAHAAEAAALATERKQEEARLGGYARPGEPTLTNAHVGLASPLSRLLPLLGNPPDPAPRVAAGMARVGHNHWVVHRLEQAVTRHGRDGDARQAGVDAVVDAYLASPADSAWKRAVSAAWVLVRRAAERTRGADPSPLATG